MCDFRCDERLKDKAFVVYYESIKRELKKRLIFDCRCDTRRKAKSEGSTSTFRVILSVAALARMLPHLLLSSEENAARLWWYRPLVDDTSWTPETVKKRSVSRWVCKNRRHTNSRNSNNRYKSDGRGGVVVIISAIFSNFVSGSLIQWPINIISNKCPLILGSSCGIYTSFVFLFFPHWSPNDMWLLTIYFRTR